MTNLSCKQKELNIKSVQENIDKIISEIRYYKSIKHKGIEDKYVAYTNETDRHTHTQGGREGF